MRARDAERQVRNAEITLLVALDACARSLSQGDERAIVNRGWPRDMMREMVFRLTGPFSFTDTQRPPLALECLGYFDFSDCNLSHLFLSSEEFSKTIFTYARIDSSALSRDNFSGANLLGAVFWRANLVSSNLQSANLQGAMLEGANLQGANLKGAMLFNANLKGANLQGADLERVMLEGANLKGTNVPGARVRRPKRWLSEV